METSFSAGKPSLGASGIKGFSGILQRCSICQGFKFFHAVNKHGIQSAVISHGNNRTRAGQSAAPKVR